MKKSKFFWAFIAGALLGGEAIAAEYNIRWVKVHEPSETADEAAADFKARVEKETKGAVGVEILSRAEYSKKYNGGLALNPWGIEKEVSAGKLEMCQTYTNGLGRYSHRLWALGMPYIFRDYDHAEKVLEGPIGKSLRDSLLASSSLRGLAFTYSGAKGIIATTSRAVHKPEDLRGLRLEIGRGNPFAGAMEHKLGIEALIVPPDAFPTLAHQGLTDGTETTFARFGEYGDYKEAKVAINTEHFILTTMIVINEKFFQTLPEKYRGIVERVALETGRRERQRSIVLNQQWRQRLERDLGVKVIDLSPAERQAFEKAFRAVRDEVAPLVGEQLVESIRETRAGPVTAQR